MIEIKSKIEQKGEEVMVTSKVINKVYQIKHIDFIEIAGEDCRVVIIGFRQSQAKESSPPKTDAVPSPTSPPSTLQVATTPFRAAVGNEYLTPSQLNVIARTNQSSLFTNSASFNLPVGDTTSVINQDDEDDTQFL
jgi:hypothetical protein